MNSCVVITSYLSNPHKEQIALDLLDFFKDKNLPIVFVGNYKIPESIQEKSDWVLYTKENPKINRAMCVWSQIPYNLKFRVMATTPDHGYAHLLQAYRGFKLASSLGYNHVIHVNYDLGLSKDQFNQILNQINLSPNLVSPHTKEGCATNFYCLKVEDFTSTIENYLHFYRNNDPPNIKEGWYCEIFFKWALDQNNISYKLTDITPTDKINEEFLYLNNHSFKAFEWEEHNQIILHFEHGEIPNSDNLTFLFEGEILQLSATPHPRYFTLPFKRGKYCDVKGNLIFNVDDTFLSRFKVLPTS